MDATNSTTSTDGHRYSEKQCRRLVEDLQRRRDEIAAVRVNVAFLAQQLTVPRARTFADEGLGRRLRVIDRCAANIFRLYPPERVDFLSGDEIEDIGIQLHAFAINVYGVLDNVAWVCMLESGGNLPPLKVSLFKTECQEYLPQRLVKYLAGDTIGRWFREYGKVYRDSTAHRIPPYLPPRAFTPDEGERWRQLHEQANAALMESVELLKGPNRHQSAKHLSGTRIYASSGSDSGTTASSWHCRFPAKRPRRPCICIRS